MGSIIASKDQRPVASQRSFAHIVSQCMPTTVMCCALIALIMIAGVIILSLIPIYLPTKELHNGNNNPFSTSISVVYQTDMTNVGGLKVAASTPLATNLMTALHLTGIISASAGFDQLSATIVKKRQVPEPAITQCVRNTGMTGDFFNIVFAMKGPPICSSACQKTFITNIHNRIANVYYNINLPIIFTNGQTLNIPMSFCLFGQIFAELSSTTASTATIASMSGSTQTAQTNATAGATVIYQTLILDMIFPYQASKKPILSANYSFPGPPIEAYEGDTLVIRVINRLNAPTTIHWHGLYQTYTPGMDGAVGVSQCAIPPQSEMTYKFTAEPPGTTWYHGHLLEQYTDGLYGPLIIRQRNEPNQDKYDTEHILTVADWYNNRAHSELLPLYLNPNNSAGIEPEPDAIVVNGKFTQSLFISLSGSTRIRFRIINAAAFSMYNISIDGLPLHIIELDQMDTLPYSVNTFAINVAQRVSFYIDLSELDSSYSASGASATNSIFIRFQAMPAMYPVDIVNYISPYETQRYPYPTFFNPLYLAILSLNGTNSTPAYPASQPTPTLPNTVTPVETNILAARPFNTSTGEMPNATYYLSLIIAFYTSTNGINYAYLNNVTYSSDANYMHMRPDLTQGITSDLYAPLLHQMATKPNGLGILPPQIEAGSELPTLQSDGYGHFLVPYQAVVDIYLNNTDNGEHPFHLHGHKFWIIATSDYPQAEYLYAGDYIQRDTVSVPATGWAKIRFVADKPGAWFFHCHIEWHMTAGLALVFLTSPQQLLAEGYTIPQDQILLCQALQQFNANNNQTK